MHTIGCGERLNTFYALEAEFDGVPNGEPSVCFDMEDLRFVTPIGFGKLFLFATTLRQEGRTVTFAWPREIQGYLRRCGMLRVLANAGFDVPGDVGVFNEGGAASLMECSHIRTDRGGHENAGLIDAVRFREYLHGNGVPDAAAADVWGEAASNAAEHSGASPTGAFAIAQAWPKAGKLQIAVVDDGIGIPASLEGKGYADDPAAVCAAVSSYDVSGRRDGAGNFTGIGGFGLPSIAETVAGLAIRSGSALVLGHRASIPIGDAVALYPYARRAVRGTLLGAELTFPT